MVDYQMIDNFDNSDADESSSASISSSDDFGFIAKPSAKGNDKLIKIKPSFFNSYSKKQVEELMKTAQDEQSEIQSSLQQQLKDLLNECSSITSERNLLRDQLKESELKIADIDEMKEKFNEITSQNDILVQKFKKSQEQCKLLEQYAQEMEDKYKAVQSQLNNQNSGEQEELLEQLNQFKSHCQDMEQQLSRVCSENEKMKELIGELQNGDQSQELLNKLADQEEENAKLKSAIELHKQDFEKAKQQFASLQSKLQQYQVIVSQMESNEKLFNNRKNQLQELQAKYDQAQANNQIMQEELIELKNTVNDQKEKMNLYSSMNQENESLANKCNLQKEKINALKQENQKLLLDNNEKDKLSTEYNDLHNKYVQLTYSLTEKEKQISDIELVLSKYQQDEKKYIILESRNKKYSQELHAMGSTVQDILKQMEVQKNTYEYFFKQFETCKNELSSAIKDKTDLQVRNIDLIDQINELKEKIYMGEKEKIQLQQKLEGYRKKVHNKEEDKPSQNNIDDDSTQNNDINKSQIYFFLDKAQKKAEDLTRLSANND